MCFEPCQRLMHQLCGGMNYTVANLKNGAEKPPQDASCRLFPQHCTEQEHGKHVSAQGILDTTDRCESQEE